MNIRWKNIERNDEVVNHLDNHLFKKIERFPGVNANGCHIDFEYLKNDASYAMTITLPIMGAPSINAKAINKNLVMCCNEASEKILDQLRRRKTEAEPH